MVKMNRKNKQSFEEIYELFGGKLTAYAKRAFRLAESQAEDVVHDAFLPWLEVPEKFNSVARPQEYLFKSVRNGALKVLRQEKTSVETSEIQNVPETDNWQQESSLEIRKALENLPDEQREAVFLKVWAEMKFEEIAKVQEVPVQTAASRCRIGLAKLKISLRWME